MGEKQLGGPSGLLPERLLGSKYSSWWRVCCKSEKMGENMRFAYKYELTSVAYKYESLSFEAKRLVDHCSGERQGRFLAQRTFAFHAPKTKATLSFSKRDAPSVFGLRPVKCVFVCEVSVLVDLVRV